MDVTREPAAAEQLAAVHGVTGQPPVRRVTIFVVVSLAILMTSLDQTIVATALDSIKTSMNASINWVGWTITVYSLGRVLVLPLAGKLSDEYGRRRIFVTSVVVFTAASLACGLANNIYVLVVLRAVQAIGGAAFMPSATGIVVDHFGDARDRAVGLFTSIFPIGAIIGPVLGGFFVAYWSWRGIFFVNVPIGVVLTVLCFRYIPPDRRGQTSTRRPLDAAGMALLGTGLLTAMLGISYLGEADAQLWSAAFLAPEAAAALALGMFLRHVSRNPTPFIPPRLLHGQGFGIMNLINFLYGGAAFGLGALVPLYAINRYRLSALDAGTLLTARGVGVIAVAGLAALALRRTGYRWPMFIGFAALSVGLVGLAAPPAHLSAYAWLAIAAGLTGLAMGLVSPAANNASLQLAPEHAAAIAALRGTCRQAGGIVSISISTAILAKSARPGLAMADIFVVFAAIIAVSIPLVRRVPEHRGIW